MPPQPRLAIAEVAPDAYRAMLGLEACLQAGPLPAALRELVRRLLLRAEDGGAVPATNGQSAHDGEDDKTDEKVRAEPPHET